jgi:hypothetical protein
VFLLLSGSPASAAHTWSAPFVGTVDVSNLTFAQHCTNASFQAPKGFDRKTGLTHAILTSSSAPGKCTRAPRQSSTTAVWSFTTRNFSATSGPHRLRITWNLSGRVNLTVIGGCGPCYVSWADFTISALSSDLVDLSSGRSTQFPNSCGGGGACTSSFGWSMGNVVYLGSYSQRWNASVSFFLNTTLAAGVRYQIYTSLFATTETVAKLPTVDSRAILDLGRNVGYLQLVSITIR